MEQIKKYQKQTECWEGVIKKIKNEREIYIDSKGRQLPVA